MKQLISLATEAIYSEQFDDMSTLVTSLSGDKDGIDLVRAYISIRIASRLTQPLSDADVDDTIEQLRAVESHLNTPDFDGILDLHKELAELHWLRKHAAILRGKLAHKKDEYSYEGTIYALQNARKGPITIEEREKAKEITKKMSELNRQIEEHELEALKESDGEAYQSYKEELEIRSLQGEIDAHEDLKAEAEVEEITARLEQKLKRVPHQESSEPEATEPGNGPVSPESCLNESSILEHYQNIVLAFSNLMATHAPLIGDCSVLPHSKKTILYAIIWVRDHFETIREEASDETLREKCDGIINTHNFLLTRLANDWHEIDPEDKDVIAKLGEFDSFPDWALPLKVKYINDEKASNEACEAAFQVMKDRASHERKHGKPGDA